MAERLEFREKLAGILTLCESQNNITDKATVEAYFAEDNLSAEQMELVFVLLREGDHVHHWLLLLRLTLFQILIHIFKQRFHLFSIFTFNGEAGAKCIISLHQERCPEPCLQVEMIGSGGATFGAIVEDNIIGQRFGQRENVTRFIADALRYV